MSETQNDPGPRAEGQTAAPPPSARTAERVKPRRRGLSGFFAIAALVLLAGGITLTVQWVRTANASDVKLAKMAGDISTMKTSIETLNARVATLEQSSSEARAVSPQLAELTMRLGALESDVARAADRDTIGQLQDRIARLESRAPSEMLKLAAATLARANLARAAQDGAPFGAELAALRAADAEDPAPGLLQAAADEGVPTRATLAARFPQAARAALDAEHSSAGGNFTSRVWASLRRLISVRRVDDSEGPATENRLARAQAALNRGDLAAAVMEVRGVSGAAATRLAPWVKSAESRIALDRAVAGLNARIVQTLAAQPAIATPSEIPPSARETNRPASAARRP
jgi:hypothetical protein